MEIKLTMPEDEIVKQEEMADMLCEPGDVPNPNMFFIAKGACEVTVRTSYDLSLEDNNESV
jgi:hypothetical protein